MYSWLSEQLRTEFEEVRLLKESPRGSVRLIRHNAGATSSSSATSRETARYTAGC